jgi:hypothetical protein
MKYHHVLAFILKNVKEEEKKDDEAN